MDRRRFLLLIALSVGAWGWAAGIWLAPVAAAGAPRAAAIAYVVGAVVCHQRPERSFHIDGGQLPVCARCTGLYTGGALGLVCWILGRRRLAGPLDPHRAVILLAVTAAPTLVTIATSAVGLWDGSNVGRALLAGPAGVAVGAVAGAVVSGDLR